MCHPNMDEGRTRIILIAAAILAACGNWLSRRARVSGVGLGIANAIAFAVRIMREIGQRFLSGRLLSHLLSHFYRMRTPWMRSGDLLRLKRNRVSLERLAATNSQPVGHRFKSNRRLVFSFSIR